jgi:hypothetical protein
MEAMMTQTPTQQPFNAREHLTQLKNKDYLEVKWRLVWFRDQHPHGKIHTELLNLDMERGLALFKATIDDGEGGEGCGHGSETVKDFNDFIEKAETKAIGRALAALGYGTQFAPELDEGERIVDAPVQRKPSEKVATSPVSQQPHQSTSTTEHPVSRPSQTFRKEVVEVYRLGKDKKYWQSTVEFYAALSAMTDKPINESNVNGVSDETLADLLAHPAA